MTIDFIRLYELDDYTWKLLNIEGTNLTREEIEQDGECYAIVNGDQAGAIYLRFISSVMEVPILNFPGLTKHKKEYREFILSRMKETNSAKLFLWGRKGWDKFFPELKYEGAIFSFSP